MEAFTNVLSQINGVVWGPPMLILIMGTGLFLTIRLGVLQFRHLGKALYYMIHNEKGGKGEVSSFGALCTAMSATVGTGNIVGVASAVVIGGPGALFWMVLAACLGMATKYSEGLLAIKYRTIAADGHVLGGPFYYIENGMGHSWKWLAKLFAIFGFGAGALGIGTIVQVNGVAGAVKTFFDPNNEHIAFTMGEYSYSWAVVVTAVAVAVLAALVIIGGIKRIAAVSTVVVPFMIVIYVSVCVIVLLFNITEIPGAIAEVFAGAFGLRAVAGGMVGAMMLAMQMGVARGVFSNEAGLGSAPIAAAAAQTNEPVRQGLVSMTGTFFDTVIICNLTGFAILTTDSWNIGLSGVDVTINAFAHGVPWDPSIGSFLLMICLAFFAFTTILGWDYYGERCFEYVTGSRSAIQIYRWVYILAVLVGPFLTLSAVWTIADVLNGLMAVPNLIALLALNGVIVAETKSYISRLNSGKIDDGRRRK